MLLGLALLAAAAALLVPSHALAERSDLLLAGLVLVTALAISPCQLLSLRDRKSALALLVIAPFAVLVPIAWGVSQLFNGSVSDGVLALGVASTEIAAVGLVAVAGGSAGLALGALTGSLVFSALAGPPLLGLLAGSSADVAVGELVVRFALVVLLPLAVGLAVRARFAALFLALSGLPVAVWVRFAPKELRATGGLVIGLRGFAVAAALAVQAFGPAAGRVAGIYGVLMLVAGAAAAQLIAVTPRGSRRDRAPG